MEDNSADQIAHYYESISYHEVPLPDEMDSPQKKNHYVTAIYMIGI